MTICEQPLASFAIDSQCENAMNRAIQLYREYCEHIQDWFPIVEMKENGICCLVFKGDYVDQEVIEEYLRTRPFTEEKDGLDSSNHYNRV